MLKKYISLFIAIAMLASLFIGCGSSKTPDPQESTQVAESTTQEVKEDPNVEPFKITISSWHLNDDPSSDKDGRIKAYKDAAIKLFNSKYPNAEIVWNNTPNEKYFDILKAKLASNSADDVFFHQNAITMMGKSGYCVDLSDQPWVENMLDLCSPYVSYQGKVIASPGSIGGWGVWYNKQIFNDNGITVPKTWGDFIKVCDTIKSKIHLQNAIL